MAYKKRPMGKRVRKLRKAPVRTRRVYRKKQGLTKLIKKVIHQQAESKQAYTTTSNASLTYFNSGINSTGDMIQVIPNIAQGTGDNARIGDQIRAQSLNIKGYVKLDINTTGASNSDLTSVYCRMMVLSLKTKPNYTEATSSSTPLNSLLKKGGTTVGFTGVLSDIYAPVNTDLFTVHSERKFYLNQSHIQNFNSTTNAIVPVDVKNTVKFFNIPLKLKNKLLKYDSGVSSGLLPANYGPFLVLGYSFLNSASPDVISARVGLHYDVIMNYEDM